MTLPETQDIFRYTPPVSLGSRKIMMLDKLGQKKIVIPSYLAACTLALAGAVAEGTYLLLLGLLGATTCTFILVAKTYSYLRRAVTRSARWHRELSTLAAELRKDIKSSQKQEATVHSATPAAKVSRTEPLTNGVGPHQYYGSKHHKDVRVLENVAMRLRSVQAREPIALSASGMRLDLPSLLTVARGFRAGVMTPDYVSEVALWNPKSLASLARVIADQSLLASDLSDACALYNLLYKTYGQSAMDKRARLIYVESLQELGDYEAATELAAEFNITETFPHHATLLQCNNITGSSADIATANSQWVETLNSMYLGAGLLPIAVKHHADDDVLQNVYSSEVQKVDGPKVSVLIPTRNGSGRIHVAVESLLNQSWSNLEIIIVDDASDSHHWNRLQNDFGSNDRIHLVRLDRRSGAYAARNRGLANSTGEFVTVHDDDDWSHAQKIELQVKHMLQHPDHSGSMSYQTRIDAQGRFLRINDNPEFNQRNYSSLLVRLTDIRKLGGWANLTRGADAEFHDRLKVITGLTIGAVEGPPLSFTKSRRGSLTDGEISKGALDFSRQALGATYPEWHARLAEGTDDSVRHDGTLPYPVPQNMIVASGTYTEEFDVIYVTDFRFKGGNSSLVGQEIVAAVNLGLRVGVAQLDSPVLRSRPPMNSRIYDILMEHKVPLVAITDEVSTSLLVLRHPTVLQYAENLHTEIKVRRSVIVVNNAPMGSNGSDSVYDLQACVDNAQGSFGVRPEVVPESEQIRGLLGVLFPNTELSRENWPGFIDDSEYQFDRTGVTRAKPVVGRHSRDHVLKWPDNLDDLKDAYVQPDVFATKILGGADSVIERLGDLADAGVVVLPFGSAPPSDFLKSVDFWVYFHHSDLTESFGMAIIEAMSSGAVCILPEYMRPMFGDGAVYCDPKDVAHVVQDLWADKERYNEQSQRGACLVRELYSIQAYGDRLVRFARPEFSAVAIRG